MQAHSVGLSRVLDAARRASSRTVLAIAALAACTNEPNRTPHATIYFVLDAPLCSSQLPVQFRVDDVLIATDTFRVNLAPNHTSAMFAVDTGTHTVSARVTGGYVWPDTTLHLEAASVLRDTLPFYCS